MIKSFCGKEAQGIWAGDGVRRFPPHLQKIARRKLRMLNNARTLDDLRVPPGNRLEMLRGDRAGSYNIRINNQWRICFIWRNRDALDVELVDYH
jgi:proteic killer suppression protein